MTILEQIKELTEVKENDKTVVYFTASWCGPCRVTGPQVEKLNESMSDTEFVKLSLDDEANMSFAKEIGISAIPTFICFKNKFEVKRFEGATGFKSMKTCLETMV